jgi:hypothetical protein
MRLDRTAAVCCWFTLAVTASAQPNFSGKYNELSPVQQQLVARWSTEFRQIFQRPVDPQTLYEALPLSARTTFEAVTHALSNSTLTSRSGKPMGKAIDLIDLVERVAGEVSGARGDRQFRVYVYLKQSAIDRLYASREFRRDRDNTIYHAGYPINFRQTGGVPSIQISVTQTGRRADIDVDYRPSGGLMALTSGHLTSANSDVRAGNNLDRHVSRWQGMTNWWRNLLAALSIRDEVEEVADFLPDAHSGLSEKANGALPGMLHAYLSEWLVQQKPVAVLPTISIRAYPCVADFSDGSKPDSRLALLRVLKQLELVNRRIGKVGRLEEAIQAVDYPLPGAEAVRHEHDAAFALQRVPEDVAWALDCRVRYGLHLVESIPAPEPELKETFVATFRLKDTPPGGLILQTWRKEGGRWRLISFAVERTWVEPTTLLAQAKRPPQAPSAEPALEQAAEQFLTDWLVDRDANKAQMAFLPSARPCDLETEGDPPNVPDFLSAAARDARRSKSLPEIIAGVEAAHPGLKPLFHPNAGAYVLASVTPSFAKSNFCSSAEGPSAMTAFHFRGAKEPAAVIFHWTKSPSGWKIQSYSTSAD